MSVFEQWSMALEDCDADAQIDYLHEDCEFVHHQSGTSLNKFEMANMMRSMLSNEAVVSSANRCLYENNDVFVMRSIVDFPYGTAAVLQCYSLKDGEVTNSETCATPISK